MKIIFVFSCSGMSRNVPCSWFYRRSITTKHQDKTLKRILRKNPRKNIVSSWFFLRSVNLCRPLSLITQSRSTFPWLALSCETRSSYFSTEQSNPTSLNTFLVSIALHLAVDIMRAFCKTKKLGASCLMKWNVNVKCVCTFKKQWDQWL